MKLVCNYLKETEELVRNGQIDIDYFKFPALGDHMSILWDMEKFEVFCNRVTQLKPILLHGMYPNQYDLASPNLIQNHDQLVCERMIDLTKTPGLSFHPTLGAIDPQRSPEELVNTVIKNVRFMKQQFSKMSFVSMENVDGPRFGVLINPEVISKLIYESGCEFLLDISHAFCASLVRHEDVRDYIKKLPLDRIYEVHINGWILANNSIMCHVKTIEECYEILQEVLEVAKPKLLTVEYGRSNDKLGVGIPLVSKDGINEKVKEEIIEQVERVRHIMQWALKRT